MSGLTPEYDTSMFVTLGAIEGELPMSAGSLHDVVMKHGPQLEMEFDRLSAQPAGLNWDQGGAGVLSVDVGFVKANFVHICVVKLLRSRRPSRKLTDLISSFF